MKRPGFPWHSWNAANKPSDHNSTGRRLPDAQDFHPDRLESILSFSRSTFHWISERGVLSAPNKISVEQNRQLQVIAYVDMLGQEILQSKRLLESISVAMHQTRRYLYRKQLTTHCQARCRLRKTMVFLSQADFFQYFFMPNEAKLLDAFSCAMAQQQQGGSHSRVTGLAVLNLTLALLALMDEAYTGTFIDGDDDSGKEGSGRSSHYEADDLFSDLLKDENEGLAVTGSDYIALRIDAMFPNKAFQLSYYPKRSKNIASVSLKQVTAKLESMERAL
ncbi:hypothetical protein SELMODRAFT_425758 [Selaginella moellendorffii]|uniref:Uncharacterized protein n=1 Tax=Selaginella moellendorffii TaxID=88036 RepID=D8SU71_SELML|nr:hypothetical protein SELMODRAFT_425758 [Selaginella moellendorffii]